MERSQGGQAVSIIDQIADERDKAQQENKQLKGRIKRLEDAYAAKDRQLSNLLHICRDNDIEVSSYDLIHGRKP
jgi:cell division septum initiation protein DivIVA